MSTNYEAKIALTEKANGPTLTLHIGKSSAGWCFSLHVHPEHGINTLADWQKVWRQPNATIVNEYGRAIAADEMLDEVIARSWKGTRQNDDEWVRVNFDWLHVNYAAPGPNGLARHTYCASLPPDPERDTYDLCTGDFS